MNRCFSKTPILGLIVGIAIVVCSIGCIEKTSQPNDSSPAPILHSPITGTATTDHTITFGWYNMEGAEKYQLQVDNNPNFSSPEIEACVVESQFKPKVPLTDDTYFWRVKTVYETNNESMWSDAWRITIFTATKPKNDDIENT